MATRGLCYLFVTAALITLLCIGEGGARYIEGIPAQCLLLNYTTDVDECRGDPSVCRPRQLCENTEGSYRCLAACRLGYEWREETGTCEDYDECARHIDDCGPAWSAICDNTNGSYECHCKEGYQGNGKHCEQLEMKRCDLVCKENEYCNSMPFSFYNKPTCLCKRGYERLVIGQPCQVKLACRTVKCDPLATCVELQPSYQCVCAAGYEGNGHYCRDKNECVARTDGCDLNAICSNTVGSYTCRCKSGYHGDGLVCIPCPDVDECQREDACHEDAVCSNTPGSFVCSCREGFAGDGADECTDVDECELGSSPCDRNALCHNTAGSFYCRCRQGYVGSGAQCRLTNCSNLLTDNSLYKNDVDECALPNSCPSNSVCENLPQTYRCVCYLGFRWHSGSHSCVDVDECAEERSDCAPAAFAYCLNTVGSYRCECRTPRYRGDGHHCMRVSDEGCKRDCYSGQFCAHFRSSTRRAYDICMCPLTHYMVDLLKNECAVIKVCDFPTTPCHAHATCSTLTSGYQCHCDPGYEGNGIYCQDVNECAVLSGERPCHRHARCLNTAGAYDCECVHGFAGDGRLDCSPLPC